MFVRWFCTIFYFLSKCLEYVKYNYLIMLITRFKSQFNIKANNTKSEHKFDILSYVCKTETTHVSVDFIHMYIFITCITL